MIRSLEDVPHKVLIDLDSVGQIADELLRQFARLRRQRSGGHSPALCRRCTEHRSRTRKYRRSVKRQFSPYLRPSSDWWNGSIRHQARTGESSAVEMGRTNSRRSGDEASAWCMVGDSGAVGGLKARRSLGACPMTIPADITETAKRIANDYHNQTPGRRERSLADLIADALLAERESRYEEHRIRGLSAPT